ncbi:hypothetical protein SADUNF_Sadunf17G0006900 [Salix dunnii]|uniref:Jacalin-type lectin domain-containing protein n=1 Tax=Salix dunnii TaxID=1413687 RepID=A0A835J4H9_9ROSI|nr:hypothetical protein SADUNF_Sadunf17G0006900 [Salix dunnii]
MLGPVHVAGYRQLRIGRMVDSAVVGFHGRCGYYLDALGIFVIPIEIDGLSEHLTSISGTYGNYAIMVLITSLSFITNLTTYGPFGNATGTSFSIPIEGPVVIGFHGRGRHYLDAIGIHKNIEGTISIGPWGGRGGSPWSSLTNRSRDTTELDSATFGGKNPNDIDEGILNYGFLHSHCFFLHVGSQPHRKNIEGTISIGPWGGRGGSPLSSLTNRSRDTTELDSATFGDKNPTNIGESKTVLIDWPSEHLIIHN